MNINTISSALQGLQANFEQLDRAAQQITVIADNGGDAVDIAASLVAMMTAQLGAEASVAAIKAENETQQRLVDIFV